MKKSVKYKLKKKKFATGGIVGNEDPTTIYSQGRSNKISDSFNEGETAKSNLLNTQLQNQDTVNKAKSDYLNVNNQNRANTAAIGGLTDTVMSVAGDIPLVGAFVKAGTAISGVTDKASENAKIKKNDANAGKGYDVVSNVVNPGESLLTGIQKGNTTDLIRGLLPGIGTLLTKNKNTTSGQAFQQQQYAEQQQKSINNQIDKYGKIDQTEQSAQADKGMKNIKYKYKKGGSGIHIKPENKGKFTATKKATGKSTEELTHSKNPLTRKRAVFAQNAKKWNHKENGTRKIETEGREPIFSPIKKDGTRDLLYYDPTAPTHKEGGVKATVIPNSMYKMKSGNSKLEIPEGSAIVTAKGNKNKIALKAYKKGDNKTLEKVINDMPEDKSSKKKNIDGNLSVYNRDPERELINSLDSKLTKTDNTVITPYQAPVNTPAVDDKSSKSSMFDKLKNINGVTGISSSLYNLGQGLFGNTEPVNRRYLKNEQYKYKDMSAPEKRAAKEAYRVNADNIRNATGGSGGSYLSNMALAANEKSKALQDINQRQSGIRSNIRNANVDIRNQQMAGNLNLANQYDQIQNMRNGKKSEFIGKGLEGLDQIAQFNQLNRNRLISDKARLNAGGTTNYTYDEKGNVIDRKKSGVKSIKYKIKK